MTHSHLVEKGKQKLDMGITKVPFRSDILDFRMTLLTIPRYLTPYNLKSSPKDLTGSIIQAGIPPSVLSLLAISNFFWPSPVVFPVSLLNLDRKLYKCQDSGPIPRDSEFKAPLMIPIYSQGEELSDGLDVNSLNFLNLDFLPFLLLLSHLLSGP